MGLSAIRPSATCRKRNQQTGRCAPVHPGHGHAQSSASLVAAGEMPLASGTVQQAESRHWQQPPPPHQHAGGAQSSRQPQPPKQRPRRWQAWGRQAHRAGTRRDAASVDARHQSAWGPKGTAQVVMPAPSPSRPMMRSSGLEAPRWVPATSGVPRQLHGPGMVYPAPRSVVC